MNNIDFEQDQRKDLDSVNESNKLSDQIVKLTNLEDELANKEMELKELKRKVELVSGEVIPTMMQEMNISTLNSRTDLQLKLNRATVLPFSLQNEKKHLNGFETTAWVTL